MKNLRVFNGDAQRMRNLKIKMKLSCLLFIVVSFSLQANSYSQKNKITLDVENMDLGRIMDEIESKTDYTFFYQSNLIDLNRRLDVKVSGMPVNDVLQILFDKSDTRYEINDKKILLYPRKEDLSEKEDSEQSTPQRNITGMVRDDLGNPLPGASVVEKGTSNGVTSDFNGQFSILVSDDKAILVFSYLGFATKEVPVVNNSEIDVQLKENSSKLDEVVVTALGIKKVEKTLGYSVEMVDGEAFEKVKTDNVMNQLNGRVAGLTIKSRFGILEDPVITLRGRNPIIIVDGIPVDSYKAVAPDEIESMSVLKGPQAAVLYGSRGKDGAVMITTKKSGNSEKLEISFNSSNMITAGFLTLPETQNEYGAGKYGEYAFYDGLGNGVNDGEWIWGPKLDQLDPSTPSGYFETPQYNSPVDPETGELVPLPWRSHDNNLNKFLQEGLVTNNHLSVSQRIEKGGYRIGVNHLFRRGMVPNTRLNGLGMHLAGDYDINDRLHAQGSLIYNSLFTDNHPSVGYDNGQIYYNILLYMPPNVDIMDLKNYWQEGQEGFKQRNHNYTWFQNPWFLAEEYTRPYNENEVISLFSLDYDINDDMNLLMKLGHNYKHELSKDQKPYAWVRGFTGNYSISSTKKSSIDANLLLTYKKSLGKFGIDGLLGMNWNEYHNQYFSAQTDELVMPGIYNLANSKGPISARDELFEKRTLGAFGSFTFSLNDNIFLNLTGRNDWSSSLAKENRSYFYPSASISAIVSDMLPLPEAVTFWKLRASWAQVARDIAPYQLEPVYSLHSMWDGQPAYSPSSSLIDVNIEPSRTTSLELGTDIRVLNDRLGLNFSYFKTIDDRWIQNITIPETSGYTQMLTNGNTYERNGFEVSIFAKPIVTDKFTWTADLNWFTNKTILKEVFDGSDRYGDLKVGERTDAFIDWVWLREPGTDNFVVDPNGGFVLYDNFKRKIGNRNADWEAGLNNTFTFGKLTLDMNISGRWGGLVYSDLISRMIQTGAEPRTLKHRDLYNQGEFFVPDNAVVVTGGEITYDEQGNILTDTRTFAKSDIPLDWRAWVSSMGSFRSIKTVGWNVYDATFFKLRSLSLGYDFTSLFEEKSGIKKFEATLIGTNLLIWKKMPHEDPDADRSDLGFPTERFIGLNLKLTL